MSVSRLLTEFLDIFFPPSPEDLLIRSLSPEALGQHLALQEIREAEESFHTLFRYHDPLIRRMVWRLKYKKDTRAAELFATMLRDYLLEKISDAMLFETSSLPLIIPMPLAPRRLRERGYNQIELVLAPMARDIKYFGVYTTHVLLRIKDTPPQTSLRREDRLENVRGAFVVKDRETVTGRNVILVDDVCTTGSTFREARRALREAGAREVMCVALAH